MTKQHGGGCPLLKDAITKYSIKNKVLTYYTRGKCFDVFISNKHILDYKEFDDVYHWSMQVVDASYDWDYYKTTDEDKCILQQNFKGTWRETHYIRQQCIGSLASLCIIAAVCTLQYLHTWIPLDKLFYVYGYTDQNVKTQPFVVGGPHVLAGFHHSQLFCAIDLSTRQDIVHNKAAQVYVADSPNTLLSLIGKRYGTSLNTEWEFLNNEGILAVSKTGSLLSAYNPGIYGYINLLENQSGGEKIV